MAHSMSTDEQQSLVDHLGELRDRIIKALYGIVITTAICWLFHEQIFNVVRAPIAPYLNPALGGLVFTNPIDAFMAHIKVAVLGGLILSCPFWVYQLWMFVAPGLYTHEKKYTVMFITSGTGLFATGVAFVYFLVLPQAFKFLLTFGGQDKPMITIGEYLSFFITTTLVFGAAFELPLILTLLGMIGLIDQNFLKKNRRYAIVVLAVLCAIITPPDMLSMLMLMVPMFALYEVSIILVGIFGKKTV